MKMSDPVSIAGSAVGIVSLGVTVAQGLIDYYTAFQDQENNVTLTTKKLSHLVDLLEQSRQRLGKRQPRPDDNATISTMESSIGECEGLIQELQEQLNKFKQVPHQGTRASLRAAGRRVAYPFRQSTLQKLDEDIDEFVDILKMAMQLLHQSDLGSVQEVVDLVRATQVSADIANWLKAPDAIINFNEAAEKKHPDTGLWFVKGDNFANWLEKSRSFLWLVGFAGCGKSVLCSTAIQYVFRHRRAKQSVGIAFFFFTFNDESKQDAASMLRSLLIQLSNQADDGHRILQRLQQNHRNSLPPIRALMDCLHQLLRVFHDVYIILDALDESPRDKHRETVLEIIDELRSWPGAGLHVMVSSRDEVDIRSELDAETEETIKMRNSAIDSDIASFISQHLRSNRRLHKWEKYHSLIETTLTERAKGV